MSAFLGPIHYWLYNKIKVQEDLTAAIAEAGSQNGWAALKDGSLKAECVDNDLAPLETQIDTANIHGWLQARIDDAEARYARLVTEILKQEPRLEEITETAFLYGKSLRTTTETAMDAYRLLDESLLDGMPCDNVNQVTQNDARDFRWQRTADLHGKYWTDPAAPPDVYYLIREAMIRGMLEDTGFDFVDESGSCRIA